MATRSLQFFMMPVELRGKLRDICEELDLHVLSERGKEVEEINPDRIGTLASSSDLYLEKLIPQRDFRHPVDGPSNLPRLTLRVPGLRDDVLYLTEIAAKSRSSDVSAGEAQKSDGVLGLFDAVKKRLSGHLKRPVWAHNVRGPNTDTVYRSIAYSEGVRRFVACGGTLMQEGVKNVRFSLERSTRP